jgi:hypothetical protein
MKPPVLNDSAFCYRQVYLWRIIDVGNLFSEGFYTRQVENTGVPG